MDKNYKKLLEAKDKLHTIVKLYVEKENSLVEMSDDNVYMRFAIGNQDYVAFSDDDLEIEEINMMFAKIDVIDDKNVLRNIELDEEYEEVVSVFNKILGFIEG